MKIRFVTSDIVPYSTSLTLHTVVRRTEKSTLTSKVFPQSRFELLFQRAKNLPASNCSASKTSFEALADKCKYYAFLHAASTSRGSHGNGMYHVFSLVNMFHKFHAQIHNYSKKQFIAKIEHEY